jgi:superfamily II RNA helicase
MLSATVPNYMDFANWVGRTKHRIVYVMKTLHRPVPLEHSLYIFNKFHVIK